MRAWLDHGQMFARKVIRTWSVHGQTSCAKKVIRAWFVHGQTCARKVIRAWLTHG